MSNEFKSNQKSDLIYWLIAVGLLFTGIAAPVGVVMIVLKLMGGKKKGRHPYYMQRDGEAPAGARTTASAQGEDAPRGKKAGGKKRRSAPQDQLAQMARSAKNLTTTGAILAAVFGCISVIDAADNLWMLPDVLWYLEEIIPLLCFTAVGLGLLGAGLLKRRTVHRYRGYLAMIGSHKAVSVSALSSATGSAPAKVRDDLEDMLDDGFFPKGFLDYGSDRLVVDGNGLEEAPTPQAEPQPAPKAEEEDAILAEIRAVNDAVANEKVSAQIDQIGTITAKILDYQRSHPDSAPQLHSFLSYYLPTTLKILRAYGQLESQEVSGENITAAMARIEGMMDKVVEGFEKQLDLLFQGDAMDITADVAVLERMLAKDGLSDQEGLTRGG